MFDKSNYVTKNNHGNLVCDRSLQVNSSRDEIIRMNSKLRRLLSLKTNLGWTREAKYRQMQSLEGGAEVIYWSNSPKTATNLQKLKTDLAH